MPKKILFAFSRDHFRNRAEGFFQRKDFEVLTAPDSMTAFSLIEEESPDLAFISLELPPSGGDACCRRVKNDFLLQKTRIILLAPSDQEESENCRDSGADAIMPIDSDWSTLVATARRLLDLPDPGRLAPRASIQIRIRYRKLPHGDMHQGVSANLATGGLFLQCDTLYPRGSRLELRLAFEQDAARELTFQARVAWVNHPEWIMKPALPVGMGVEFLDLSLQDMAALDQYVCDHMGDTTAS